MMEAEKAKPNKCNSALQWRHNECDGVSNHQPHNCLLNRWFKVQIKENTKALRQWPLWGEFTNSLHEGPVMQKMFPFDDANMDYPHLPSFKDSRPYFYEPGLLWSMHHESTSESFAVYNFVPVFFYMQEG